MTYVTYHLDLIGLEANCFHLIYLSLYSGIVLNRTYVIEISFSLSSAFFGNHRLWLAQGTQVFNDFAVHVERGHPMGPECPWTFFLGIPRMQGIDNLGHHSGLCLQRAATLGDAVISPSGTRVGLLLFTIKMIIPPSSVFFLCNAGIHPGSWHCPRGIGGHGGLRQKNNNRKF